jgi:hypothetical protein
VLHANLVVMDLTRRDGAASRSAHLWQITELATTRVETSPVQGETFAFKELPATFGISVTTNGIPEVVGPDFRSLALTAASFASTTTRVEVVLLPEIRLDASVLAEIASDFTASSHTVTIEGGSVSADLLLTSADASLELDAIVARVAGEAKIQSPIGGTQRGPFAASGKLRLMPSAAAATADAFDMVSVSDLSLELPGILGSFVGAILPMIRGTLSEQIPKYVRPVLSKAFARAVTQALMLPELPEGVTVSTRRLVIEAEGIALQPALGALGTSLSAFTPPRIPPP